MENGSDMDQPAHTEVTNGLMFGLSKVRSALETRKYIMLAGHTVIYRRVIIGSCAMGPGPVSEWGRSISQFGPLKKCSLSPKRNVRILSLSVSASDSREHGKKKYER